MGNITILYELNFALWCFASLTYFSHHSLDLLTIFAGIALGGLVGFLAMHWWLKPLDSAGEIRITRKTLLISAILVIAFVYLFIYPGPLEMLTASEGVTSTLWAAVPTGWGGYALALLNWERKHNKDIVSPGRRRLGAIPKRQQASKQLVKHNRQGLF